MTKHLAERIATTLGWSEADVRSFSLPSLRAVVRSVSPKLAHEITQVMRGPDYYVDRRPRPRRRRSWTL